MIISVFKTSLDEKDLEEISPVLNNFNSIINWNTDLEDCDNILRTESNVIIANEVISILNNLGFQAQELEDS